MRYRTSSRILIPLVIAVGLLAAWQVAPGFARLKTSGASRSEAKAGMSQYLVIAPHTPDQCLATLDAVKAMPNGTAALAKWEWGCMSGDHTGYLIVSAASPEEALRNVPETERGQARAVKLNRFTPAEIKSFHEMKK
jgi:hypothetical protein